MTDLRYIVMCDKENKYRGVSFQCSEPEQGPSSNDWYGGFSFRMTEAILYSDYESAKKVCNRISKMYPDFRIRVITKSAKEIFVERLAG